MMDISIIVPVYNVSVYLPQCINSIRDQTYKSWELILIDDGSKDKSGEICDMFCKIDDRIKAIHINNSGVSVARNIGLDNATGEYVAFVDGDDWIEPNMLEKLVIKMKEGADITFCRFVREYEDKTIFHYERNLQKLIDRPYDFTQIIYEYDMEYTDCQTFANTVFGSVCRSLFRKKIIDDANIVFPVNVRIAEDRLFLMEYLLHCQRVAIVEFYGYHYRAEREGSAITTNTQGYQNNLFGRRKEMLEIEFQIIYREKRLTKNTREDLITYEKYKLCFDTVINELLYQSEYKKILKEIFGDPFMKNAISLRAFAHMRRYGFSFKRQLLYILIRLHDWDTIRYILNKRRGSSSNE